VEKRAVFKKVQHSSATCASSSKKKAIKETMQVTAIQILRIRRRTVKNRAKNKN
jgi:hypothetical protein